MANVTVSTAVDLLNVAARHGLNKAKSGIVDFLKDNAAAMTERPDDLARIHEAVCTDILHQPGETAPEDVTITQWLEQFRKLSLILYDSSEQLYWKETYKALFKHCSDPLK